MHPGRRNGMDGEKKKVSVVLRNYDIESTLHTNGINSMAVDTSRQPENSGTCNLFTASRDRLIKVWHADYSKMQASVQGTTVTKGISLLADLDDHTDWVNQIKIIPDVKTLISCSNDTTIRIWRYRSNHSYEAYNEKLARGNANKVYRQRAFSTFQDHDDYVRCIDYARSQ